MIYKQILNKFPNNKKAMQEYQKLKVIIASKTKASSGPQQKLDPTDRNYSQFHSIQQELEIDLNNAELNYVTGLVKIKSGALSEGLPFLKKALHQAPNSSRVWMDYIKVLLDLGNTEEARSILRQAKDQFSLEEGFDQFDERVSKSFSSPQAVEITKDAVNTKGADKSTLYCFYDMAVSPCSYDFFTFLYSAEICRVRRSLDEIKLFIVHGSTDQFKDDHRSPDRQETFFQNVIIPGISLLPSISSHRWLAREELKNVVPSEEISFPRGYSISEPTTGHVPRELVAAQLRRDHRSFLRAPKYALNLVENLIYQKCLGGPFITLTTRELIRGDYNESRTIKKCVWQDVFTKLKETNITPIIVRDTMNAHSPPLFKDVIEVPEASIHLPLRMALYEQALINFTKNNGPACLHLYGNTNAIMFNHIDNAFSPLSQKWLEGNHGHCGNGQFPMTSKSMKMIWEEETSELILNEIEMRAKNPKKQTSLHELDDTKNISASWKVGLRLLLKNLDTGLLEEDVDLYIALENINNKFNYVNDLKASFLAQCKLDPEESPRRKNLHSMFAAARSK